MGILGKWKFDLGLISRHRMFIFGFAALWIVLLHMRTDFPSGWLAGIPAQLQRRGMCGVEIFLLLSGFGLYNALSRNGDIFRFWKRRLMRVFLPALTVSSLYLAVSEVSLADYIHAMTVVPYLWSGRALFWYVAFIMLMYALYPLLFHIQKRRPLIFFLGCGVVSAVCLLVSVSVSLPVHLQRPVTRVPVFLLGCVIAPYTARGMKVSGWLMPVSAALFVILELFRLDYSPGSYGLRAVAFVPLAVFIIMACAYAAQLLARFKVGHLAYRCIAFVGVISLEMYLLYERVLELLERFFTADSLQAGFKLDLSAFVISFALAYIITVMLSRLRHDFGQVRVG